MELPLVAKDRDAWRSQLELLFRNPKNKRAKENTQNLFNVFSENDEEVANN